MKSASWVLSILLVALVSAPSGTALPAPVQLVHGQGVGTYWNDFLPLFDCSDFRFDAVFVIQGDTAVLQMPTYHDDAGCMGQAYAYAINPVILEGSWEEGWYGFAVGADPPGTYWPWWEVRVEDVGYDGVWLWSYYIDNNGRQHWFEGIFDIVTST